MCIFHLTQLSIRLETRPVYVSRSLPIVIILSWQKLCVRFIILFMVGKITSNLIKCYLKNNYNKKVFIEYFADSNWQLRRRYDEINKLKTRTVGPEMPTLRLSPTRASRDKKANKCSFHGRALLAPVRGRTDDPI